MAGGAAPLAVPAPEAALGPPAGARPGSDRKNLRTVDLGLLRDLRRTHQALQDLEVFEVLDSTDELLEKPLATRLADGTIRLLRTSCAGRTSRQKLHLVPS